MSESLKVLFKDVGKSSLLSREEEVELSKKIELGDDRARKRMIESNMRLAISIAKKYRNRGCDFEDLVQESSIGLMKAVDRFDWRRGFKFSTYACWWIKQSVRRHLASQSATVRIPSHAKGLIAQMNRVTEEYQEEFGTKPSEDELIEILGITRGMLRSITTCARYPSSLDTPASNCDDNSARTLSDIIPDPAEWDMTKKIEQTNMLEMIKASLHTLSAREEKVLRLRFGITDGPLNLENGPHEINI